MTMKQLCGWIAIVIAVILLIGDGSKGTLSASSFIAAPLVGALFAALIYLVVAILKAIHRALGKI